jgi:hypothetical protein
VRQSVGQLGKSEVLIVVTVFYSLLLFKDVTSDRKLQNVGKFVTDCRLSDPRKCFVIKYLQIKFTEQSEDNSR